MKFNQLQKRLIKTALIGLAIIAVLGGIYYFISSYSQGLTDEIAQVQARTSSATGEANTIQSQVNAARDAMAFYDDYSSTQSADPQNFRREFAKTLLSRLKEELGLPDLKFTMEQFQKVGEQYERPTVALFESKVMIQFAANSDIQVYNLMKSIIQLFPGQVKIVSYKINKKSEINDEFLTQLSEGKNQDGIVMGELIFLWQSIQDNHGYKGSNKAMPGMPGGAMPPTAPGGQPAPPTPPGGSNV